MNSKPAIKPASSSLSVRNQLITKVSSVPNVRQLTALRTDLVCVSAPWNRITRCVSLLDGHRQFHAGILLPAVVHRADHATPPLAMTPRREDAAYRGNRGAQHEQAKPRRTSPRQERRNQPQARQHTDPYLTQNLRTGLCGRLSRNRKTQRGAAPAQRDVAEPASPRSRDRPSGTQDRPSLEVTSPRSKVISLQVGRPRPARVDEALRAAINRRT